MKDAVNADVAGRALGALPMIRFGTDGWRAIIAREFTFANLERVAQAFASFVKREAASSAADRRSAPESRLRVVVGYDRRFMSEDFAARAAEVLNGNDINALLFPSDVPTPLVSWAVRELSAAGGVMITASHNPPHFNGFKIKAPWGGSAAPEMTSAIEALIDGEAVRRDPLAIEASASGELDMCVASYRRAIAEYVDLELLRANERRVVIDAMHGAGGRWVESFLTGGAIQPETIRANRDALFGGVNPEPIDLNLGDLKKRVQATNALVGLATDGDADRVGAVDETGATMTMHEVVSTLR